jgi:hypothetical protein
MGWERGKVIGGEGYGVMGVICSDVGELELTCRENGGGFGE